LFGLAGAQGATYTCQFKASPNREDAEEEVKQLKAKNVSAYIVKSVVPNKGIFYRVRAGVFSNQADAKKFGANLQQRGVVSAYFVTAYEKPFEDDFESSPAAAGPAANAPAPEPAKTQPASKSATTESRPVAQKAANNAPLNNSSNNIKSIDTSASNKSVEPRTEAPANPVAKAPTLDKAPSNSANPGLTAAVGEAASAGPPTGFLRFRDPKTGYSFDYPEYWTGQSLSDKEASEQRMNAGAMFSSQKDTAFLSAIWNELDKANNTSNENDLIVDVILRSMSSSDGISKLEETGRRVENRNGLIKTYLELKAVLQTPEQASPLDFLGKAVIVRANRGILLIATFYAKDSPPNVAESIDRIIASARPPE